MKSSTPTRFLFLSVFGLMAFAFISWNNSTKNSEASVNHSADKLVKMENFVFSIDSRFQNRVTQEKLLSANTIREILPDHSIQKAHSFQNVKISLLDEDGQPSEYGQDEFLTDNQKALLSTTEISNNIFIGADYRLNNPLVGDFNSYQLTYYISIIPTNQASYSHSHTGLVQYLKSNSFMQTSVVDEKRLQPGRISFTIQTDGTLSDVNLDASSGYPSLDNTFQHLIANLPGKWEAATNARGEKVSQELTFFYGKAGC
ncbi:MAG: hypothetical protein AAGA77_22935 [Bacteroidota bacterium]